ncbi:hypothetical protein [Roseicyclus elongatus]|nr:hypothetical protein [Roseibacterium elongatum]
MTRSTMAQGREPALRPEEVWPLLAEGVPLRLGGLEWWLDRLEGTRDARR